VAVAFQCSELFLCPSVSSDLLPVKCCFPAAATIDWLIITDLISLLLKLLIVDWP